MSGVRARPGFVPRNEGRRKFDASQGGLELGHFIISLRHRDANRVAETMSAFIGEQPEIVGEKFTGFLSRLPFSPFLRGKVGRGRTDEWILEYYLSCSFFFFFVYTVSDSRSRSFGKERSRGRVSFI